MAPRHVVHFSGGTMSWAAGKRAAERYGTDGMVLLFADVMYEDEDTYRYLEDAAANIGAPLIKISDGRNPWQVFRDVRMIGNTRMDPCSRILKRELLDRWVKENCDANTVHHFGLHASEIDRFHRLKARMSDRIVSAPLCERPAMSVRDIREWEAREGLKRQRLYAEGFAHANCGGRCVKQGHAGWALLLRQRPESYAEVEEQEEALRQHLGKDVSIIRDRSGGKTTPLTLRQFRERVEAGTPYDLFDFGGCGCAIE